MSFVISSSQRLAAVENTIEVQQLKYDVEGFNVEHHNVGFGHPLYTYAADIVSFTCTAEEGGVIPVMPSCGLTIAFAKCREECRCYVCGATGEMKKIEVDCGDMVSLIIFIPGVVNSLLTRPVAELTGKVYEAAEILNGSKQIYSCLRQSMKTGEKLKLISTILRTYILQNQSNDLVQYCLGRIYETGGIIKVEELAQEADVTARYIGKLFETHIGLSAKYCAGIVKIRESVRRIKESPEDRLTDIAADCGYFDHTHMNKAFRKMLFCSSGEIRESMFDKIDYESVESYIPKFN